MSDEVNFLRADEHEAFLQIIGTIFDGDRQALSKLPK